MISTLLCLSLAACGGGETLDDQADAAGSSGGAVSQAPAAPPRSASNLPPGHTAFSISAAEVLEIAKPFGTAHEALPAGVPSSYDWARFSRKGSLNDVPTGFTAFTGWGHVFWAAGARAGDQAVEIRDNQSYLCTVNGTQRQWQRVQQGDIEGAAFLADFAGNANIPAQAASLGTASNPVTRVNFPAGRAYHYWPRMGRVSFGTATLCGVVVMFQARAVAPDGSALPASAPTAMVIGAGADYWLNTSAPWNNYQTNTDVALGQLRRLTPQWRWYGMATPSATDLQTLLQDGFVDRTKQ